MGALDMGSANRKVLLIQDNTTHRKTHTLMSCAGLEPMSPVFELLKTSCRKPTGHSDRPRYVSWLLLRKVNHFCGLLIWNIYKDNTFLEIFKSDIRNKRFLITFYFLPFGTVRETQQQSSGRTNCTKRTLHVTYNSVKADGSFNFPH
jgi:hypothetical protein